MIISPLTLSAVDDVYTFVLKYKKEQNMSVDDSQKKALRKALVNLTENPTSWCFLCQSEQRTLLGYIVFHLIEFPMLCGRELYISDLFIDSSHRGKGIGNGLLEKAEEMARQKNCLRMMLNNPKEYESYKRDFYKKLGFVERVEFANFVKRMED